MNLLLIVSKRNLVPWQPHFRRQERPRYPLLLISRIRRRRNVLPIVPLVNRKNIASSQRIMRHQRYKITKALRNRKRNLSFRKLANRKYNRCLLSNRKNRIGNRTPLIKTRNIKPKCIGNNRKVYCLKSYTPRNLLLKRRDLKKEKRYRLDNRPSFTCQRSNPGVNCVPRNLRTPLGPSFRLMKLTYTPLNGPWTSLLIRLNRISSLVLLLNQVLARCKQSHLRWHFLVLHCSKN